MYNVLFSVVPLLISQQKFKNNVSNENLKVLPIPFKLKSYILGITLILLGFILEFLFLTVLQGDS